jgi:hypothetical protein
MCLEHYRWKKHSYFLKGRPISFFFFCCSLFFTDLPARYDFSGVFIEKFVRSGTHKLDVVFDNEKCARMMTLIFDQILTTGVTRLYVCLYLFVVRVYDIRLYFED